jgi:N6-L-threonylcarbamoyladenine synthase
MTLFMPEIRLCTDNGAMIGSAAYYRLMNGEIAGLELNAMPALRLV